jgi:hypothetical protein
MDSSHWKDTSLLGREWGAKKRDELLVVVPESAPEGKLQTLMKRGMGKLVGAGGGSASLLECRCWRLTMMKEHKDDREGEACCSPFCLPSPRPILPFPLLPQTMTASTISHSGSIKNLHPDGQQYATRKPTELVPNSSCFFPKTGAFSYSNNLSIAQRAAEMSGRGG